MKNLSAIYPGQTGAVSNAYPLGSARNVIVEGDGTGTPLEEQLVNDIVGHQQALLREAGIAPSGNSETALASDQLDALRAIVDGDIARLLNYRLEIPETTSGEAEPLFASDKRWMMVYDSESPRRLIRSVDGVRWFTGATIGVQATIVEGGDFRTIVIDGDADDVFTTVDGGQNVTTETVLPSSGNWTHAAHSEPLSMWLVAGTNKAVSTTSAVSTWTSRTTGATGALQAVSASQYAPGFVVTVPADQADIYASEDGVTWATVTMPVSRSWGKAVYSRHYGRWFIVGYEATGTCSIYSADTVTGTWTAEATFSVASGSGLPVIAAIGRAIVIAGNLAELSSGPANVQVFYGFSLEHYRRVCVDANRAGTDIAIWEGAVLHNGRLVLHRNESDVPYIAMSDRVASEIVEA